MNKEELLMHLWQLQEWFEEQEILEFELKKKENLLKITIEEAQAEFLKEKEERFYSSPEYNRQIQGIEFSEKVRKNGENILLTSEVAMTILGIVFIYLGMPLLEAAAWWLTILVVIRLSIRGVVKYYANRPDPNLSIGKILEEAKTSEEYLKLEQSALADYLKLEISFLKNKASTSRQRIEEKSTISEENRGELSRIIEVIQQDKAHTIEQALKLLTQPETDS